MSVRSRLSRITVCESLMIVPIVPIRPPRPAPTPIYPIDLFSSSSIPDPFPNPTDTTALNVHPYSPSEIVPIGTIVVTNLTALPAGFLYCNGAEVSRVTYCLLFDLIGTSYGNGDGATTFHLPMLWNALYPALFYLNCYSQAP